MRDDLRTETGKHYVEPASHHFLGHHELADLQTLRESEDKLLHVVSHCFPQVARVNEMTLNRGRVDLGHLLYLFDWCRADFLINALKKLTAFSRSGAMSYASVEWTHYTPEEFAAEGYTHVECFCPRRHHARADLDEARFGACGDLAGELCSVTHGSHTLR
jgi:hypothetical protein